MFIKYMRSKVKHGAEKGPIISSTGAKIGKKHCRWRREHFLDIDAPSIEKIRLAVVWYFLETVPSTNVLSQDP